MSREELVQATTSPFIQSRFADMGRLPSVSSLQAVSPEVHWQFIRTELANERTFLAWVRTTLSMFSIGFAMLKVEQINKPDDLPWYDLLVGLLFCSTAFLCAVVGVQRYFAVKDGLSATIGIVKDFDRIDIRYIAVILIAIMVAALARVLACIIL